MSVLEDVLRIAERHIDYDNQTDVPDEVFDVLRALVGEVQALRVPATPPEPALEAPTAGRVAALKAAREHVEAMSTNGRGYQDGVKLSDKVAAVERFARFLMGEGSE